LFTSIIPNLIVPGVNTAIQNTSAKLIYIVNVMTKYGETQNFQCSDFVRNLESFMGRTLDAVIYNNSRPDQALCDLYAIQKSEFVIIRAAAASRLCFLRASTPILERQSWTFILY
ncbi:MAG: 2-phospho-L-lactate transferase CofD family protein, partial [Desulfobacterales bacterium]